MFPGRTALTGRRAGALSSIPLLLYSSFLYTFTASQFIPSLPRQYRLLAKQILIFFIPVIVVANEIGSFLTLSYRTCTRSLFLRLVTYVEKRLRW